MKTKLQDLNEYMFECLDRLTNDSMTLDQLEMEIDRANAAAKVAETIIKGGELALRVYACANEAGVKMPVPKLLEGE